MNTFSNPEFVKNTPLKQPEIIKHNTGTWNSGKTSPNISGEDSGLSDMSNSDPVLIAPSTGNGPASGQPLDISTKEENTPLPVYQEGWFLTTYNTDLRAVANNNTVGQAQTRYLGRPNMQQYYEMARNQLNNGSATMGWGAFNVNTNGDISAGIMKKNYSSGIYNGNSNVTFNPFDPSLSAWGGGGIMVSNSGFSGGPLSASRSINVIPLDYDIVKDIRGTTIGTVNTNVVIQNMESSVIVGLYSSYGTIISSYTNAANGGIGSAIMGTLSTQGIILGGSMGGVDMSLQFSVKNK